MNEMRSNMTILEALESGDKDAYEEALNRALPLQLDRREQAPE